MNTKLKIRNENKKILTWNKQKDIKLLSNHQREFGGGKERQSSTWAKFSKLLNNLIKKHFILTLNLSHFQTDYVVFLLLISWQRFFDVIVEVWISNSFDIFD